MQVIPANFTVSLKPQLQFSGRLQACAFSVRKTIFAALQKLHALQQNLLACFYCWLHISGISKIINSTSMTTGFSAATNPADMV